MRSRPSAGAGEGSRRPGHPAGIHCVRRRALVGPFLFLACLAAIARIAFAFAPWPGLDAFRSRGYSTRVLDRNGGTLAILPASGGSRREYAALADLPPETIRVFTGSEDRRFFLHSGVDPAAIARSLVLDLAAGRIVSGASTITMQLARLVTPGRNGLRGKLADAFDALRIEAKLPKKAILELYLNSIPFGAMREGVASASRLYFGKEIAVLSPAELCLLAVIPRRPALYDPRTDPKASAMAASRLAESLRLPESILPDRSFSAFSRLAATAAAGSRDAPDLSYTASMAPHFIRHWFSREQGSRPDVASRLPPVVVTSIDPAVQRRTISALRGKIAENKAFRMTNGAGIVVDNASGEILAWVGSGDFDDAESRGQIDGVRALNQPGSLMKPFLYALAMEEGYTPASLLPDLPADFGAEEAYVPANFNNRFNGPVRLRVALASSLNVPAVHTLERVRVPQFVDFLGRLGFASVQGLEEDAGVGLALGNASVSLFELVRAFSVFPRGGFFLPLAPIRAVGPRTVSGSRPSASPVRVMTPYAAGIVRDILSDQPSRFAGFAHGRMLSREYDAMFKTGTANQFQHVWALGATPDFTAGIWMGNFTGETVVGKRSSGVPASVLVEVLDAIARPESRFPGVPDSTECVICALSGLAATSACPGTLIENMPRGRPMPAPCDIHPARRGPETATSRAGPSRTPLRFIHPRDGAVFYFDSSLNADDQAIGVRLEGLDSIPGGESAWLYVDGVARSPLAGVGKPVIPLARGNFRLSVMAGGRELAFARISVR